MVLPLSFRWLLWDMNQLRGQLVVVVLGQAVA